MAYSYRKKYYINGMLCALMEKGIEKSVLETLTRRDIIKIVCLVGCSLGVFVPFERFSLITSEGTHDHRPVRVL